MTRSDEEAVVEIYRAEKTGRWLNATRPPSNGS